MAIEGVGVLVTRAAEQSSSMVDMLRQTGARVYAHPVIEIAPPQDPRPLRDALDHLTRYDWIIFTSVNAVEAVWAGLTELPSGCQVACVGTSTAAAVEAHGGRVSLLPPKFDAESLADALIEHLGKKLSSARFLLPRAAEGRETLPLVLGKKGARVEVVEAYRTVPSSAGQAAIQALLRGGQLQVLTFTSGSTVKAFDALLEDADRGLARQLRCFCLGPTVLETARQLGYNVQPLAAEFTIDALVTAISAAA